MYGGKSVYVFETTLSDSTYYKMVAVSLKGEWVANAHAVVADTKNKSPIIRWAESTNKRTVQKSNSYTVSDIQYGVNPSTSFLFG